MKKRVSIKYMSFMMMSQWLMMRAGNTVKTVRGIFCFAIDTKCGLHELYSQHLT